MAIKGLPTHKATGHDGIPSDWFQTALEFIERDVVKLLQETFDSMQLNPKLNLGVHTLVLESGSRTFLNNYMPISVLTSTYNFMAKGVS